MSKAHPVENDVKDKVKKLLDAHGWTHIPVAASRFGVGGVSDRIAIRGRARMGCIFMAVEVKLDKPTATPRQEKFLADVRAAGGIGIVVNMARLPKFEELLRRISEAYPLKAECSFCEDSGEACACNDGNPAAGLAHRDGDFGW